MTRGIILLFFLCLTNSVLGDSNKGVKLYESGKIKEAEVQLLADARNSLKKKDLVRIWHSYTQLAWYYHMISDYRKGVGFSLIALRNARLLKDKFKIGKSLNFVGWSYSQIGRYKLAEEFFKKAIYLSSYIDKDTGKEVVSIPMVWGLASQELGHLYIKIGKVFEGEKFLLKTFKLSKKLDILQGISESGAYLARLELLKGNLGKAVQRQLLFHFNDNYNYPRKISKMMPY
ncbi:MAG: tetratricopeptide (TPR) repeat protein [Bacteriovoracaceae bacterium]|jgi:tetratricopeptide (TPR) repeat protein